MKIGVRSLVFRVLIGSIWCLAWLSAHAGTIVVDRGFPITTPGNGICDLPDAVEAANTDSPVGGCDGGDGDDVISIELPAGTDDIRVVDQMDITSNMTITTPAGRLTTITLIVPADGNGNAFASIFDIAGTELAPLSLVRFENLELTGGNDFSGGGAINASHATVDLDQVQIRQNRAGRGAGIEFTDGHLTLRNCSLLQNTIVRDNHNQGAGLYANDAVVEVDNCLFRLNTGVGYGGAIYATQSDLTISNSVFEQNIVAKITGSNIVSCGGAICLSSNLSADIDNSTFSNNQTERGSLAVPLTGAGGAINARNSDLTLTHSTVTDNASSFDGGGIYAYVDNGFTATITIANSLVTDNLNYYSTSNGGVNDVSFTTDTVAGELVLNGVNLFGASHYTTSQSLSGVTTGPDQIVATSNGSTPTAAADILEALQDNGSKYPSPFGALKSHALPKDSPAIDSADTALCAEHDQRGYERNPDACDIGAFESTFGVQAFNPYIMFPRTRQPMVIDF